MVKLRKRWLEIWRTPSLGPAEVILSLTAIAYGGGLLLPQEEFMIYRVQGQMASNFSEWMWGLAFLIVGILRMTAVLFNSYRGRIWLTLLSIGTWLYLCLSFLLASPLNPRVIVLFVWAMCEAWTLFRIHQRE